MEGGKPAEAEFGGGGSPMGGGHRSRCGRAWAVASREDGGHGGGLWRQSSWRVADSGGERRWEGTTRRRRSTGEGIDDEGELGRHGTIYRRDEQ
ncbi:hypothetical protein E2562_021737 [Oryza meyeriana var. granulata]|uniref:Uncharacterized protein n=1 Tax=Oryza meyeriana var. granulata TaxID=110450 RepID=A0A6G1E0E6_9ORYZ|nr:hypothetical protein E2562_021737 [Oryza meyeriana var. granulata]